MKNKYKNILIIIISLFFLVNIIKYREIVFTTVSFSLNIWLTSLLPSLFPFFVISDILINYDIVKYIPSFIRNLLKKIFNISDNGLIILLLSILSGFPSNARNIKSMYLEGKISKKESEHLLLFTHFSSPMFIISTISLILNNNSISKYIMLSHYLSNFLIAFLLRNYNNNYKDSNKICNNNNLKFSKIFSLSIKKSLDSILSILGILMIFLIISNIIINFFNLNNSNKILIKSILELTSGINELSFYNLSNKYLLMIVPAILSFGGLSVHMQVINELNDTDISYKNFFLGRILQVIISLIVSYIICLFIF